MDRPAGLEAMADGRIGHVAADEHDAQQLEHIGSITRSSSGLPPARLERSRLTSRSR